MSFFTGTLGPRVEERSRSALTTPGATLSRIVDPVIVGSFDRTPGRTHWLPNTRESGAERRILWETCVAIKSQRVSTLRIENHEKVRG